MSVISVAAQLRARRQQLQPGEAGLTAGARRRVPGLRRSEVAWQAGISSAHYARLENGARPSESTTAALARALRMDWIEYVRLAESADRRPRPDLHVAPGHLTVLDALDAYDIPAWLTTDGGARLESRTAGLVSKWGIAPWQSKPLERIVFHADNGGAQLVCHVPVPGTGAADWLAFLRVVGVPPVP
ncbi:helix-turn-helix domain-containing protein [Nocardia niigatensis]